MEGWKRGRGLKREAKMDWRRKVEVERQGERERRGKMGPVVVEMSATGAAEMERDAQSGWMERGEE